MTPNPITRDDLLNFDDSDVKAVEVPEWGGSVYIRSITVAEREAWEDRVIKLRKAGESIAGLRAELVARTLSDSEGNRLLKDSDVAALSAKNSQVVDRLFEESLKFNGLTESDVEDLKGN